MAYRKMLILYGSPSSIAAAKAELENQPFVQMITEDDDGRLSLQLKKPITEISLIPLLKPFGVSGFRLL